MAIRIRKDGRMFCAAHAREEDGDTYVDDTLHYEMSVVHGVIVALPMPQHIGNPEWWWINRAPPECDFTMVLNPPPAPRERGK